MVSSWIIDVLVSLQVEEVLQALRLAFETAFQENSRQLVVCEACPMHQYHKLCQEVEGKNSFLFNMRYIVRKKNYFRAPFLVHQLVTNRGQAWMVAWRLVLSSSFKYYWCPRMKNTTVRSVSSYLPNSIPCRIGTMCIHFITEVIILNKDQHQHQKIMSNKGFIWKIK